MTDEQRSFWAELRERKVMRVATVYAVVGWGVVLVGAELVDILQLPAWVSRLVLLMAVLGFPIALVLAWAFELTPDGVRRTPGVVSGATTRLVRIAFIGGLAIGITAIASIASMMSERPDADVEPRGDLDPELVAILPFRYSGPEDLDYLGDGVFQLLASRFTGEVGPRATDPAATAASWDDATAADPMTVARAVAERLGAGLVLTGSVVAGPDGLNISATMRDLTSVEDVVTASVLGPPDSLTAVVERLAGAILSLSVGEYEENPQDHQR